MFYWLKRSIRYIHDDVHWPKAVDCSDFDNASSLDCQSEWPWKYLIYGSTAAVVLLIYSLLIASTAAAAVAAAAAADQTARALRGGPAQDVGEEPLQGEYQQHQKRHYFSKNSSRDQPAQQHSSSEQATDTR